MKIPAAGGTPVSVGPPGFGRLNDIHVHKSNPGSPDSLSGQCCLGTFLQERMAVRVGMAAATGYAYLQQMVAQSVSK